MRKNLELDLDDIRQILAHVHVPRRKRDKWAAYSALANEMLPHLNCELRDSACRLIAAKFRV